MSLFRPRATCACETKVNHVNIIKTIVESVSTGSIYMFPAKFVCTGTDLVKGSTHDPCEVMSICKCFKVMP